MPYVPYNNTPRIIWVDYYKAIGIFLIVFGHSMLNNADVTNFLFLFHVPLFFFISGYLEKNEYTPPLEYLKKIAFSLIIPYFIWNIISIPALGLPLSFNGVIAMLLGLSRWNAASWFIMILVFLKINALFLKNKQYYCGSFLVIVYFLMPLCKINLPYLANITFMFSPFFFFGMYCKNVINLIARSIEGKVLLNIIFSLLCLISLLLIYNHTTIVHTNAVIDFIPQFYLFWITGFVGLAFIFFVCQCFTYSSKFVTMLSSATLFIMCSHYEIVHRVTKSISPTYGDISSLAFVFSYFTIQCACIPIVLKYIPILAGRKRCTK